ncbi:SMI1/KNR4 family protein [Kitasatospora sp. LaBMicrA B282]|uniref:SMI1/KNR4 family protein n=1 Tax=Kitasatospora sp. LaBMicrA B282 TaxID=3420949 RepID=UPI003D111B90
MWRRIEAHLAEHAPGALAGLAGPAGADEIAEQETRLGFGLPADFAASLAVHREIAIPGLQGDAVRHWDVTAPASRRDEMDLRSRSAERPGDEIRNDWDWRPGWMPVTLEPDGSHVVLDLDPGPEGRYGQLVRTDQGVPDGMHAPSRLHVLSGFAAALEAGHYAYLADRGGLNDTRIR